MQRKSYKARHKKFLGIQCFKTNPDGSTSHSFGVEEEVETPVEASVENSS